MGLLSFTDRATFFTYLLTFPRFPMETCLHRTCCRISIAFCLRSSLPPRLLSWGLKCTLPPIDLGRTHYINNGCIMGRSPGTGNRDSIYWISNMDASTDITLLIDLLFSKGEHSTIYALLLKWVLELDLATIVHSRFSWIKRSTSNYSSPGRESWNALLSEDRGGIVNYYIYSKGFRVKSSTPSFQYTYV